MSLQVLQSQAQIEDARRSMRDRNISALDKPYAAWLQRLHLVRGPVIGDVQKSWDVDLALRHLESTLQRDAPILDIGCYASEVLLSLHKLGFTNLTGVDLNPRLTAMPLGDRIKYVVSDFMQTPFENSSFQAITSVSVIEHGYKPRPLLAEVARLLRPGGTFLASFDYWPDKIDTTGVKFFDMSWLIFSRDDVQELIDIAATFDMTPQGALVFEAKDRVIACGGKHYTFAALNLTKRA